MKQFLKLSTIGLVAAIAITGCSYKATSTPAVMTYDGSDVDYSTIDTLKHAKICKLITSGDGDITTITAAKAANISKIKHVDTSYEYDQFLIWQYGHKKCVTVYGE